MTEQNSILEQKKTSSKSSVVQEMVDGNSFYGSHRRRRRLFCLRRKSLQTQLLISFGLTTFFSIGFIVVISIITTQSAGKTVISVGSNNVDKWTVGTIGRIARKISEVSSRRFQRLEGMILLIQTITQERFVGYPNTYISDPNISHMNDRFVPFQNYFAQNESDRFVYPLKAKNLLPFEWEIQPNIFSGDDEGELNDFMSHREHIGDRFDFYFGEGSATNGTKGISTVDAAFSVPCHHHHHHHHQFWSSDKATQTQKPVGCPNIYPIAAWIRSKASDYVAPVLKALYEFHEEVKSISIHFFSDGQSATATFPGRPINRTLGYMSEGCAWMKAINPRTGRPIATTAQIAKCHPDKVRVSADDLNVFEQRFCREAVQANDRVVLSDPLFDEDGFWITRLTRAVWDAKTNELLACIQVDIGMRAFADVDGGLVHSQGLSISFGVLRWDDRATIINSSQTSIPVGDSAFRHVGEYGFNKAIYEKFRSGFMENYNRTGDFENTVYYSNGWYIGAYPHPLPKFTSIDRTYYKPEWVTFISVAANERDKRVASVTAKVNEKVSYMTMVIAVAGAFSITCILLAVYLMSLVLTMPLKWMDKVGNEILASVGYQRQSDNNNNKSEDKGTQETSECSTIQHHSHDFKDEFERKTPQFLAKRPRPWSYWFSPRTEVTQLVDEFQTMVKQFSGQGTSRLIKKDFFEMRNPFESFDDFQKVYDARRHMPSIQYQYEDLREDSTSPSGGFNDSDQTESFVPTTSLNETRSVPVKFPLETIHANNGPHIHLGRNTREAQEDVYRQSHLQLTIEQTCRKENLARSSIFWSILGCVALPLILFMVGISTYVLFSAVHTLPLLIEDLETMYTWLQRFYTKYFAQGHGVFAAQTLNMALRDLHLLNRMAGWLFFGALAQSHTFTTMMTGGESCKDYPLGVTCPAIQNTSMVVCDCQWEDSSGSTCHSNYTDSRLLQSLFFEGLRQDADPITGERNHTSFPALAMSPNETRFWDSIEGLPGALIPPKGNKGKRKTAFDRVQTVSALSAIQIPLYNYVRGTSLERSQGSYLAFDADGMLTGYAGCQSDHLYAAHIQVTSNSDEWSTSELCHEGQFGLDSRCYAYLAKAKANALATGISTMHFTTSTPKEEGYHGWAIAPLIDRKREEFIGHTFLQFSLDSIYDNLNDVDWDTGFFRLLFSSVDGRDREIVHLLDDPMDPDSQTPIPTAIRATSIVQALFPNDECEDIFEYRRSCRHLDNFYPVLSNVLAGDDAGRASLTRTGLNGEPEVFHFNWGPVKVKSLTAIDPADFSRGTHETRSPVMSVMLAQTEQGVLDTFTSVEAEITKTWRVHLSILVAGVVTAFLIVAYVSGRVALSLSVPVTQLCAIVSSINQHDVHAEFPTLGLWSTTYEVARVRGTFERLHMLIRAASSVFFRGQLEDSFEILNDALKLFTKLHNSKAIGIANSNLGNVMLAMYRTMSKASLPVFHGMDKDLVVQRGCHFYKEAIDIGEEAIQHTNDQEGWSEHYLVFMQQLSNRYFNRAMFLFSVKDDHWDPREAVSQGQMDLQVSKDMDREVVDSGDREGFKGDRDTYMELLLGRIKGNLFLMKMGYEDEWGVESLLETARITLLGGMRSPTSTTLFKDLGPVGYMQRLDGALIEYHLTMASKSTNSNPENSALPSREAYVEKAATVAIRMLFEDEYIIADAALLACRALIELTRTRVAAKKYFGEEQHPSDILSALFQCQHRVKEIIAKHCPGNDVIGRESFVAANIGDFTMEAF